MIHVIYSPWKDLYTNPVVTQAALIYCQSKNIFDICDQ